MPKDTFHNLNPYKKDRIMKAAIDEFATHFYNEVKLSRIIKAADIPRGSFYQYFEDKADLYSYLFQVIAQEKLKCLGPDLNNPDEIPFIELFRKLMRSGFQFAADNPEYIQITRYLMANRGSSIFQRVMGDGMDLARQYYRNYIEIDKKHGRIRLEVDTELLTDIVIETTTNLSFLELSQDKEIDLEKMLKRMEEFIQILQKGIEWVNIMFKVENLTYRYPKNEEDTIRGISFDIDKGEIFGFLGPSGAEKSTTQKVMIKVLENFGGGIFYDGKSITEFKDDFYENIGVSFEMPIHFSKMTAIENVNFFLKLYKRKGDVEDLLKRTGLWEDRDKMVGEFSKGMKIRLNFVRAMLNDPEMLFLDEPTNGLDPKNAMILKDMVREFRDNGGTVFITSHIMSDIDQLCDRVAFIVDGKIIEMDTPRNLKIKYGKRSMRLEYKEDGETILKEFPMDGIGQNEEFLTLLQSKEIETLHSGETTLEDIFIKVTGVQLADE